MLKLKMKTGLVFFLFFLTQSVIAQYATEIFIPLGQSPGLSGSLTTMGRVSAVNIQNKSISVSDSDDTHDLKISNNTKIWLDQSKLKLNNKKASIRDIREGMRAEVKYIKNEKGGAVEWIKIQLAE